MRSTTALTMFVLFAQGCTDTVYVRRLDLQKLDGFDSRTERPTDKDEGIATQPPFHLAGRGGEIDFNSKVDVHFFVVPGRDEVVRFKTISVKEGVLHGTSDKGAPVVRVLDDLYKVKLERYYPGKTTSLVLGIALAGTVLVGTLTGLAATGYLGQQ